MCGRARASCGDMRAITAVLWVLSVCSGCCARPALASPPPSERAATPAVRERVDASVREVFAAAQVEGVFVLRSLDSDEQLVSDARLAGEGELPASTFKIPAALIALDRGVLAGADAGMKWDGVTRDIAAWNRDATLASALRDSTVWFFQETARRVGAEAMRRSLAAFGYGNADIGGGIDRFWLAGQLRISPREQVEFVTKLHRRALPVARGHMELVEHLITRAQAPGWSWRGKTGSTERDGKAVGWLVGLTERDGKTWAYALLIRAPQAEFQRMMPLRPKLTRELLIRYGALPADAAGP